MSKQSTHTQQEREQWSAVDNYLKVCASSTNASRVSHELAQLSFKP